MQTPILSFIIEVGVSVILSLSGTSLFLWMMKTWLSERLKNAIKNEYDIKLEEFKYALKLKSDTEIEKLRYELKAKSDAQLELQKMRLAVDASQRNLLFSKLHENRASVIADAYALLRDAHMSLQNYTSIFERAGGPTKEQRRKEVENKFNDFNTFIRGKIIFLPQKTAEHINKIISSSFLSFNNFMLKVEFANSANTTKDWIDINNAVSVDIKSALHELENDFRILLGDGTFSDDNARSRSEIESVDARQGNTASRSLPEAGDKQGDT